MNIDYSTLYSDRIDKVFITVVTLHGKVKGVDGIEHAVDFYFCDNDQSFMFNGHEYVSTAFKVTEPDKDSLEQGTGSFQLVGVTNDYVRLIQQAEKGIEMTIGVVRLDQLDSGEYILEPTEYTVNNIAIDGKTASIDLSLQTGGALGFFASTLTYSPVDFPGLSG